MNNCVVYTHVDYVCMVILLTYVIIHSLFSCILCYGENCNTVYSSTYVILLSLFSCILCYGEKYNTMYSSPYMC